MFIHLYILLGNTPEILWNTIQKSLEDAGLDYTVQYLCSQCVLELSDPMEEIPEQATPNCWNEKDFSHSEVEKPFVCKAGHWMSFEKLKFGNDGKWEKETSEGSLGVKTRILTGWLCVFFLMTETIKKIIDLNINFISDVEISILEDAVGATLADYWFTFGMQFSEIRNEIATIESGHESSRQRVSMILWKLHSSTEKIPVGKLINFLERCLKEVNNM